MILYELLAGKMPYTLSRHLHEAVRTIQETDPAPLSTVSRVYRGDIETIVAKALEKDKERRYASAAELAGDIRRYLNDEPIVARPASTSYQLQKFARRNKALVVGIAAVFAVLVLGIVASTWEAVQARRAENEGATSNRPLRRPSTTFCRTICSAQASAYNQSGPGTKPDPDLKVRTALDRAAERITGKFGKQPEVEATIRDTMGQTYQGSGAIPGSKETNGTGARPGASGARRRESQDPQNHEPPWPVSITQRVSTRGRGAPQPSPGDRAPRPGP